MARRHSSPPRKQKDHASPQSQRPPDSPNAKETTAESPPPVTQQPTTLGHTSPVAGLPLWLTSKRRYAFAFGLAMGVAILETVQLASYAWLRNHAAAGAALAANLTSQRMTRLTNLTTVNYEQFMQMLPQQTWRGAEMPISMAEMLEMLPVEQSSWLGMFGSTQAAADESADDESSSGARPGQRAAAAGLRAHHPIVMIPGIITSGLELWAGHECAKSYFRQRLWGTMSMFRLFMRNKDCWVSHISLNATTGRDPEGVKVRAAQGFEAADYAVGTYWVWAPLIENLADLGYDASNMWMAAYDWRLPFAQLEKRDQFFSRLRFHIEMFRREHGTKVAVLCHSMGGSLWLYFQQWLTSPHGARLSSAWLDEHVDRVVLIGAPVLGAPKVIAGLLMGESRDFTHVTGLLAKLVDAVLSPGMRRRLLRSWGSAQSLLPMGGDVVWGDALGAPDDPPAAAAALPASNDTAAASDEDDENSSTSEAIYGGDAPVTTSDSLSYGLVLQRLAEGGDAPGPAGGIGVAAGEAGQCVAADGEADSSAGSGECAAEGEGVVEAASTETSLRRVSAEATMDSDAFGLWFDQGAPWQRDTTAAALLQPEEEAWHNPLLSALPFAPNLTIHCLYGVGKPTERAYAVRASDAADTPPLAIDRRVNGRSANGVTVSNGVLLADGDGSVPLLSLGYMCAGGWRRRMSNPSGSKVVTREYRHHAQEDSSLESLTKPLARSPRSADHVDILGNHELLSDVLALVSRGSDPAGDIEVRERFLSDMRSISARIDARVDRAMSPGAPGAPRGPRRS